MRSALYYPHTSIGNEQLVKMALLLWDRLEYIVPWPQFRPRYSNRSISAAMELIGAPHCPDENEKKETHALLEGLVNRELPPEFYFEPQRHRRHERFEIYPEKLLPDSWQLLQRAKLSGKLLPNSDYPLSEHGGLMVMSALADCCAGNTRSRVTDRGDAYATIASLLGNEPYAPKIKKSQAHGQLVPICLKIIDTKHLRIDTLIKLREREAKDLNHTLRDLRHRYVDGIETYISRLVSEKTSKADAIEVQRQFADDMEADIKDLRAELGFARGEALFSKELFATVLTAVGTAASWLFGIPLALEGVITLGGVPAAIGGLMGARNQYLKDRHAIMKEHPMAYLYEARRHGL